MKVVRNITIVGSGYVGMSLAALLSKYYRIKILDIDAERVKKINLKISTIKDDLVSEYLNSNQSVIQGTLDKKEAYDSADIIIIATPTNYDVEKGSFDTSSVDNTIEDILNFNKKALIVIKSTIPVGHTASLQNKYNNKNIIFSPEFLREGNALEDNLYPSRIIVGASEDIGDSFAYAMENAAIKHVKTIFMSSTEAESVKLFANSYLAMRVAYFNELDSFAFQMNLNAKNIINGISLDQRIGNFYNNPSFGYGGYCLPKDTKQLLSSYKNVPQDLIKAIVNSNNTRKEFIAKKIIEKNPNTVGFYRLIMKSGSDNNRFSSIHDIIKKIQSVGIETFVFEPTIKDQNVINGSVIINDLDKFKNLSEIVVANRISEDLNNIKEKVFSRDIFNID